MLTENTDVPGVASTDLLLSNDEASQFGALERILPDGWVVELQADAWMAWAAFVYQADAPRSRPVFTICRWDDRVGLFTQWVNGSASSAMAFTELWPVLELVPDGIFAFTLTYLATVLTKDWTNTQH